MSFRVRTRDWAAADRVERWREEFGRHVIRADVVACGPAPETFDVDLRMTGGASLAVVRMGLTAVRKVRDASWFGDGADSMTLMLCRSGSVRYDTADRRAVLRPGEATLFSHRVPVALEWDRSTILTLQLPGDTFAGVEDPAAIGRRIAGDAPAATLLRAYAEAVSAIDGAIPDLAERHLVELARAAVAAPPAGDAETAEDAIRAARLAAARAMIARHATRPGFGIGAVAGAMALSPRTLQRDFASAGTSFGAELMDARLQAAWRLLADAAGPRRRVGDIALDAGFGDLSHFNRHFRARFGCAPSEVRAGVASLAADRPLRR